MSEPNPNWVEAPYEVVGWNQKDGEFREREIDRFRKGSLTVVTVRVEKMNGKLIRLEERKFPTEFKARDYQ